MKTINENGTFRKRSPEWNFLKTLFSRVLEDRRKQNLKKTLRTHYQLQSTPRNIRNLFWRWRTGASLSCLSNLIAFFKANLALLHVILKLIFPGGGRTLSGSFTFATSVMRWRVGSPFSLTLSLPWFWPFKLFLRLWRTSQQYKPTPKKFKDGANLLFRGLIIANTYASSMRSRVSYRFLKSIHRIRVDGRKRYERTRIFFEGEKSCVFKRIWIRVDRAWVTFSGDRGIKEMLF